MALTYGDIRALIATEKLGWQPRADIPDYVRLPLHALGASSEGLVPEAKAPKLDWSTLGVSSNPYLAVHRAERGLIKPEALHEAFSSEQLRRLGLADATVKKPVPLPPDGGVPPTPIRGPSAACITAICMKAATEPCTVTSR